MKFSWSRSRESFRLSGVLPFEHNIFCSKSSLRIVMKRKFHFMYYEKYTLLLRDFHTLFVSLHLHVPTSNPLLFLELCCEFCKHKRKKSLVRTSVLIVEMAKKTENFPINVTFATRRKCQFRMIIKTFQSSSDVYFSWAHIETFQTTLEKRSFGRKRR